MRLLKVDGMELEAVPSSTAVLFGLESSGKSALFRALTGAVADESNFRGSTVFCRKCHSAVCRCDIIDTPGIRLADDVQTTRQALAALEDGEKVALVVRGTHLHQELTTLMATASLGKLPAALIVTFADKAPKELAALAQRTAEILGIPYAILNARLPESATILKVAEALGDARSVRTEVDREVLPEHAACDPQLSLYEHRLAGPVLSVLTLFALFAVPVWLAYLLADSLQGPMDRALIEPLVGMLEFLPAWAFQILCGSYGVLTLGWYSFLWAFPVVLLIGVSTAVAEETGIKDRITAALDPVLRHIGLSGRDLIPVLSGFGCNVVAVFQSRACSACTRKSCVSLISFGSACSYQIGATLSLFSVSGNPWLFAPYLAVLFFVGAIHTRLWHGALAPDQARPQNERAFLQSPSWKAVRWRAASVIRMFLVQAMPIFLLICVVAAALDLSGAMDALTGLFSPMAGWFGLPAAVTPAVLFSILRKDGLLILNEGEGELLATLSTSQVFVLVYLASTLTACLVTLWTIRREMGWRTAGILAGRQALTAGVSAWILAVILAP